MSFKSQPVAVFFDISEQCCNKTISVQYVDMADDGEECCCLMYNFNSLCWLRFDMDSNELIIHFGIQVVIVSVPDSDAEVKPDF